VFKGSQKSASFNSIR